MSLRQGQNQKKPISQEQHVQERGFETFLHGANEQRVQQKRQTEKVQSTKNLSKERKKWQEQQQQQQQQEQFQLQQKIQGQIQGQRQKWNKIPQNNQDPNNQQKGKKQQYNISNTESESIANYIQTMGKDELDMLRQSLMDQNISKMKRDYSSSPTKAMVVEEDDELKDFQYDQEDEEEDEEYHYKDEAFDNIEEEIQEDADNQSELYQPPLNDRSYNAHNQNNYYHQQVYGKPRPISAIEQNKYSSNQYDSNFKNYESSHNIGKYDSGQQIWRKQSDNTMDQRQILYNEETKKLNSNPFNFNKQGKQQQNKTNVNMKEKTDKNVQDELSIKQLRNPQQLQKENSKDKQKQKNAVQEKDKGLEDLFIKLSRMNEGVRSELVTLIDKIGNGELDVSAIKSLLFMQNSNQSVNTNVSSQIQQIKDSQHVRIFSEPQISTTFEQKEKNKMGNKHFEDDKNENINSKKVLHGGEKEKSEAIKFSRDQFSVSLSKGLLQNTQELEKTLNLENHDFNQLEKDHLSQIELNNKKKPKFQPTKIEDIKQVMKDKKSSKQEDRYDQYQDYFDDEDEDLKQNYNKYQDNQGYQNDKNQEEYFEEEPVEEEDEPINNNFLNKLNKNKLKDTLQMKQQKEAQAFCSPDLKKIPTYDDLNSERSSKKSELKQNNINNQENNKQESNKTYNLSKNREKQTNMLKDIKEMKGEVFIIIRVISTWGSAHLVGLTEIKVYDEEGNNIKLKPDDFMIEGGAQTSLRNIHRICDGIYDTIDSEHMWQGTMPDPPKCMEIGIRFKSNKGLGAIKIWNYNKSLIDSVKGIKEIEITRKSQLIWAGQIKKGLGKEHENYGDVIKLKEDIILDDDKPKQAVRQSLQGVNPTKVSVNVSKDMKGGIKSDEKIASNEQLIKQPQKKQLLILQDDGDIREQGRQRGINLPTSSSNTPTPSSRIRSAQQKNQQNAQIKENDDETQTQTTASTSNLKKNIEKRLGKEVETDSLQKALQAKDKGQKSGSLVPRNRNSETQSSQNSLHSVGVQNKIIGVQNFESQKPKQKQDDQKNSISQTGSGKTTPSNSKTQLSNQISEQNLDTNKISKKGPKVLNVYDDKQSKGQTSSSSSLNQKEILQESPTQKTNIGIKFQDEKEEFNFEKNSENIKKQQQTEADKYQKDQQDIKKKSSDDSSSGKVDDFMENVKFFNATHQGRFQPAERERILQSQANDVQQAVKLTLQNLNPFFQQNIGNKLEDDNRFKSEDDSSDYNNKIDVFMKESSQLQQHLAQSINKNAQERQSQIKSKSAKTVLEDEEWILDQILRDDSGNDEKQTVSDKKQNDIFSSKKSPKSKDSNSNVKSDQTASKQEPSTNLDETNQFEREMNKLLQSRNDPFLSDIMKQIDQEGPKQNQLSQLLQDFTIPNLPEGRNLKIEIYSTWGDSHYVGLSGIEIFDSRGNAINIKNPTKQVKADPSDINVLPEYGEDPRTCDKLVDGCYLTCDDLHMWLAPYQKGKINYIYIDFLSVEKISMIRIWNYNKSRIHSYRGAKDIQIFFDEKPIFAGPLSRAQGNQQNAPNDCEYIMFTDKENIISQIEKNDWLNTYQLTEQEEEQNVIEKMMKTQSLQRPLTGNNQNTDSAPNLSSQPITQTGKDGRPITSAKASSQSQQPYKQDELDKKLNTKANQVIECQMKQSSSKSLKKGVKCSRIKINILKSWEDKFYVGLTGIELYDEYGQKIPIKESQLKARPRDLNDIAGYHGDQRTLDKLVDGVNLTTNEKHMWLVQLLDSPQNFLQIDLMGEKIISGIKIWNYNKQINYYDSLTLEPYRGVKVVSIIADENTWLTPQQGIILRKAPGRDLFDYGQMIALPYESGWTQEVIQSLQLPTQVNNKIIQEYDTIYLPRGFCFRINIHSTWGDAHYCGLNGIEFFDSFGNPIIEKRLSEFKLGAEPASVNILPGCQGDIRTIDKLVNGQNNTFNDRNMWLSPFINQRNDKNVICPHLKMNTIYINFEKPVIISAINFWNYSKSPSRGVREIEIFLDDKLIFRGYIKKAPTEEQHMKDNVPLYNTIIFNRNEEVLKKIQPVIYNEDKLQQNVVFHNEGKIDSQNRNQNQQQLLVPNIPANPLIRPTTKVSGMKIQQN